MARRVPSCHVVTERDEHICAGQGLFSYFSDGLSIRGGDRFKSCQPDIVMSQDIADTRTHGNVGSGVVHFGFCGW